jgi:hypothetical protein
MHPMLHQEPVRVMRARAQALADGVREDSAAAVVQRVFAIQAQDATAADLGIRARGRDITASAIRTAYDDEKSIVRNWFMRGTLHTIPGEDAGWALRLLGPHFLAATSRRYQQLGLDDGLRQRSDHMIRRVLGTHGPLTRAELTDHLIALGISPDGQAPFHLIRHAALVGIVCHGPQRDGDATYVLLDDWLPSSGSHLEQDAGLAELARRYLIAFAPAGVEDFATWSGLPVSWSRRAWKKLAQSATITTDAGLTVLARRDHQPLDKPRTPDVRLLPAYDNYLTGYRTREGSVPAAHQARVWPGGGTIRATVVADGLAVATWTRRSGGRTLQVEPFEPLPPQIQTEVDTETAAVVRFLRSTVVIEP